MSELHPDCPFLGSADDDLPPRTTVEILRHYAQREPTYFRQFDGFHTSGMGSDYDDGDGDAAFGGGTYELMSGCSAVRVLVRPDTAPADATRLLRKIADWIDRVPELIGDAATIEAADRAEFAAIEAAMRADPSPAELNPAPGNVVQMHGPRHIHPKDWLKQ